MLRKVYNKIIIKVMKNTVGNIKMLNNCSQWKPNKSRHIETEQLGD